MDVSGPGMGALDRPGRRRRPGQGGALDHVSARAGRRALRSEPVLGLSQRCPPAERPRGQRPQLHPPARGVDDFRHHPRWRHRAAGYAGGASRQPPGADSGRVAPRTGVPARACRGPAPGQSRRRPRRRDGSVLSHDVSLYPDTATRPRRRSRSGISSHVAGLLPALCDAVRAVAAGPRRPLPHRRGTGLRRVSLGGVAVRSGQRPRLGRDLDRQPRLGAPRPHGRCREPGHRCRVSAVCRRRSRTSRPARGSRTARRFSAARGPRRGPHSAGSSVRVLTRACVFTGARVLASACGLASD